MKKTFKIILKILGVFIILLVLAGAIGWFYVKSNLFNFEEDYTQKLDFKELTVNDYTFLDRNGNGKLDIYEDDRKSINVRVEDVLSQMTIEEKIHLLKGSGVASAIGSVKPGEGIPGAAGTIVPTPRLGLPTVYLSDGPAGLRIEPTRKDDDKTYYCTAFPVGTLLASTWNVDLVKEVGNAMGDEAKKYGIDVILGPGMNIQRNPLCGRNFEYYSEDPYLSGFIGAAMVNGIESNGVGTSVKHFVANNQETKRKVNNAIVSERALREIYLKGFEIAVKKAQPWTIMSSYNKVNGTYTSESEKLLTDILRKDWKFKGMVMSDWFGGSNVQAMISAGNDLLEPGTNKQWKALIKAHKDGKLTDKDIDKSVRRILKLIFKSQKMKNYKFGNNPDLKSHANITRRAASEGMVLLKNKEKTLPLQSKLNVALLGVTSFDFIAGGTGSGDVNEAYTVSLEEGMKNAGYKINATAKNIFIKHKEAHSKEFIKPKGFNAMLTAYSPPQISYTNAELNKMASESQVAIITIGRNAGEGGDRKEKDDFKLTLTEQKMIKNTCTAFHKEGKPVIVVLNVGSVIETASWKSQPDAILLAWQEGQEGGNSVADILSGKVNPSGKLPMTFANNLNDYASNKNFPQDGKKTTLIDLILGTKEAPENDKIRNKDYTHYDEGIYVGYRQFDKDKLDVSYPFGYGLSYTQFKFSNLVTSQENDTIKVSLKVTNIGNYTGKEVVQVYASKGNSKIDRPIQELKSFVKTDNLKSGDAQDVVFKIPVYDLRYWNEETNAWTLEKGTYSIRVGSSSRDIRIKKEIEL